MKRFMLRATLYALLAGVAPALAAVETARYKTNLPPPVEIEYKIKARQRGIPVDGSAVVRWSANGTRFSVVTETHATLLGKIMDARTEGLVDEFGLAPERFNEKRLGKAPTATSFNRSDRTIRFSASDETYPIQGGEQDRNSIVWQLVAVARAAPARFRPGSEWTFFVAGQRDGDIWTFKVLERERLRTALGELDTVRVARLPPDERSQKLDVWLAPKRDWYPVKLRFADENGDYIEQTLKRIARQK